jgi:hypothetical protein
LWAAIPETLPARYQPDSGPSSPAMTQELPA